MKINSFEVMFLVAALLFSVTPFANAGVEIEWLTYLGGTETDGPANIALDAEGNVYVAGQTQSADFPTTPVTYDVASPTTGCIFVAKFNPTGSQLIYSNVIGKGRVLGLAVDEQGNAYITGSTRSVDFPVTPGAFQTEHAGWFDVFVTKISASGDELIYSTFLGGTGYDTGRGIAIDAEGNAYVAGNTTSPNFPTTPGAYDPYYNYFDGFVAKINPTGTNLVYSTTLGVASHDPQGTSCSGIAVDSQGCAYVTGSATDENFPVTPGAFDTTYNDKLLSGDAFVTKFNSSGSALVYSTFLGGERGDYATAIDLDNSGNVYIIGNTDSSNFPTTPGAYKVPWGWGGRVFASKLNASGSALIYSSIVAYGSPYFIAIDGEGNAYIVAHPFLLKLSASGSQLYDFSSIVGAIAVDAAGGVYIAGGTRNPDLATAGAFDITHNGGWDVFVAKVHLVEEPIMASELWPFYE